MKLRHSFYIHIILQEQAALVSLLDSKFYNCEGSFLFVSSK